MRLKNIFFLLSIIFHFGAKAQNNDLLFNKFWRLKTASINNNIYNFQDKLGTAPTMQFSGGSIRGNGGCNAYHSKFTLNGSSIEFNNVFSTKMACTNLYLQESLYFEAISQLHVFEISNNGTTLKFTNSSGDELIFYNQFSRINPPVNNHKVQENTHFSNPRVSKKLRKSKKELAREKKEASKKKSKKELAREKKEASKKKSKKELAKEKKEASKKKSKKEIAKEKIDASKKKSKKELAKEKKNTSNKKSKEVVKQTNKKKKK